MKTITQENSGLPRPPISADDVPTDELPTRSLKGPTPDALRAVEIKASELAEQQDDSKEGEGLLFSSLQSAEAHIVGKVGEIVSSAVFDFPLDTNIYPDGDPGYDHVLQETTIDTKTTATDHSQPRLVVSADDVPPADLFVLVHIINDEMARVIGFTDHETVVNRSSRRWPGNHPNYVVGWDELYPPRWFDTLVTARIVTETRDSEFIHEHGCQLCGAHLSDNTEYILPVDEDGIKTELALCDDCHSLLSAAREEGRVADFQIYERPP